MTAELSSLFFEGDAIRKFRTQTSAGKVTTSPKLPGSLKTLWLLELEKSGTAPLLIITKDETTADAIVRELEALAPFPIHLFPDLDVLPDEKISPSIELVGRRILTLSEILKGRARIVVGSVRAVARRGISRTTITSALHVFRKDMTLIRDDLLSWLESGGYRRGPIVGERGEYAIRGGIVDIYPPYMGDPIRLEMVGDRVASLRTFDVAKQTSIEEILEARLLPAQEKEQSESILDGFLPPRTLIIFDAPLEIEAAIHDTESETRVRNYPVISIESPTEPERLCTIGSLGDILPAKLEEGYTIFLVTEFFHRLDSELRKNGIPFQANDLPKRLPHPGITVLHSRLGGGFLLPDRKIAVWTDRELFPGGKMAQRKEHPPHIGVHESLLIHFQPGDYVVHEHYGIGKHAGMQKLVWDGEEHEYFLIEYGEGEELYVPLHQMDLVKPYRVREGFHPRLDRLGSPAWQRVRTRVEKSVEKLTLELVEVHAARKAQPGFSFPPDTPWQIDLEESFLYEETPDQQFAAADIKRDMESERPMDRLLCGDVGFGKTEVALRAAFKAASAGKQVAVLVPTTILAEQHFRTFHERLHPFPVRVEMLSRFRTPEEQQKIIEQIRTGGIDIVIGTHRLLQKDVQFKDLGLLIIDEEHRFGVAHKERLKKWRQTVDVLTLTATPIPRTLHMALSGAQDISQIATPPKDRSPIHTIISKYSDVVVREAIDRELERGGQVFYVHNRVATIQKVARELQILVPHARISVGHGQMSSAELESVMHHFVSGETHILVCTSIIESGLDLPNANTIIIDNATHFGLADLYQLRGRVGRAATRAYAYILYDPKDLGSGTTIERLQALQEFTALGSGYKLALRDLEIRGAGNLLGREQHGHLVAVGFDMYCEMLERAVMKLKGKKDAVPIRTTLDINISGRIPENYIEDENQRIATYQRLGKVRDTEEISMLAKELRDRFGVVPPEVEQLLAIIQVKIHAAERGVERIRQIGNTFIIEKKNRKQEVRISATHPLKILQELEKVVSRV